MVDDDDILVASGELLQDLSGIVGTGVVDEDDLSVNPDLVEHGSQALVHMGHGGGIAVARDDGAQLLPAGAHLGVTTTRHHKHRVHERERGHRSLQAAVIPNDSH